MTTDIKTQYEHSKKTHEQLHRYSRFTKLELLAQMDNFRAGYNAARAELIRRK
jgi:hypothetical protein